MDYKIVIDPGHGGLDPGASGNGIIEKNLALDISKHMYDKFRELNIPVTLTRTTDETLDPTERVNRILSSYSDDPKVIVISNHINAGGSDGAEVIYALRNTNNLSNSVIEQLASAGQNIRKSYQRRLPTDTSKDYYFIHRDTGKTEPIIIEYGFLDSTKDDVEQLKNNYQNFADAVVSGVLEYINIPYPSSNQYHTVLSGESLYSIAKKYGVSVDDLKQTNNLTTSLLSIGSILKIPIKDTTVDQNTYTVVNNDTLYSIAKKFNITVNQIKLLNNLNTTSLSVGQVLKIPPLSTPPTDYINYTVIKGDNLYSISKGFGLTQEEIMKFNNLTSNLLSIGQTIKIPTINQTISSYKVVSGDTLYTIANKFNTTVDEIKKKNNLLNNNLQINQILII